MGAGRAVVTGVAAGLGVLLAVVAVAAGRPDRAEVPAALAGDGAGDEAAGGVDDEVAWDPRVVDLVRFVEDERGLRFRHPVAVELLDTDAYLAELGVDTGATTDDELDDEPEEPPEAAASVADDGLDVLRALGVVAPADEAAEAATGDDGSFGFYDYDQERLVVRGPDLSPTAQGTIVHELTHVLDDQHFDLDSLYADPGLTEEQFAAREALVEGDAVRVEDAWVGTLDRTTFDEYVEGSFGPGSPTASGSLGELGVAALLQERVGVPYNLGGTMVDVLVLAGGDPALDAAFRAPPDTTEGLLDPRALVGGEQAAPVEAPVPAGTVEQTTTLGAVDLFLVLTAGIDAHTALAATDGWGGDVAVTYAGEGGVTCVDLAVVGDTAADTDEIAAALADWGDAGAAEATAERRDDGAAVLHACPPAGGPVEPLVDPGDAVYLPIDRSYHLTEAMAVGGLGADEAFAYADCVVRELTLHQIIASYDDEVPAATQATIDDAVAGC
ncbi:MAG TPA: hypothetical protein VK306_09160 [Acidimicrobiales bacterium]|nr:hypothetical protein [Acidimicrobiales bacterium]